MTSGHGQSVIHNFNWSRTLTTDHRFQTMSIISEVIESTKAIIRDGRHAVLHSQAEWTVQYPEEPVIMQPRYRDNTCCMLMNWAAKNAWPVFLCRSLSFRLHLYCIRHPRLPEERVGQMNATQRFTTSTTGAASSVVTASRRVPRTQLPMATISSFRFTTARTC